MTCLDYKVNSNKYIQSIILTDDLGEAVNVLYIFSVRLNYFFFKTRHLTGRKVYRIESGLLDCTFIMDQEK